MAQKICLSFLFLCLLGWAQSHYNTHQQTNNHQHQQATGNQNDDFLAKHDMEYVLLNFIWQFLCTKLIYTWFTFSHLKKDVQNQYYVDLDKDTSQQEMDFYNFKLHDYDNNLLLDGLELLLALNHDHEAHSAENNGATTGEPTDGHRQHQQQGKFDQDARKWNWQ